jgi:hypothetical protein
MLIGGFWTPQTIGAADGVNVSNMNNTHGIATGVSLDGLKACVVWAQFDVGSPQAYARVLDVLTSTWNPPLNAGAFQVSSAGNGGTAGTRCTFDSNGNLHVTWQQKSGGGSLEIMHRSQTPAGVWSAIAQVADNGDAPDIAADNAGRIWVSYHKFNGDNAPGEVRLRSWNGSWGAVEIKTASGAGGEPRVGVDNSGYVHLAWKNGGSSRGYAFYNSTNDQFSNEVAIPGSNSAGNFSLAVNRENGDVHVAYAKNSNEIYYAKKTGLGSTSFLGQMKIVSGDQNIYDPRVAVSGGQVTVVFDNGKKDRIDYVVSNDNGGSWSGVSSLANPGGQDQAPWIASDANGNSYIAYAHDGFVYFTNIVGFVPVAERCSSFADVRNTGPACPAITSLTQAGVIQGYDTNPPTFGPNQSVQRAQIAAFLVRALGWQSMNQGPNTFNDFGPLVGELREASLILANACTNPSDPNTCVAKGYGDGRFGPNDGVTYAQVMTFIARAFIFDGTWRPQSAAHPYNGVPQVHESDVRTYHAYAGLVDDVPMPSGDGWNQAAPRAWVAVVLYQALQASR